MRLGQPLIRLCFKGEPFDPLKAEEDEFGGWKSALFTQMETHATYTYVRRVNTVVFRVVRPKRSPLVLLPISLAAAVVVGLSGSLLPDSLREMIVGSYIAPITSTYLDVLGFLGIPMIFLSVALGINAIDDINVLDRIGKRMMSIYLLVLLTLTLLAGAAAPMLFGQERKLFGLRSCPFLLFWCVRLVVNNLFKNEKLTGLKSCATL